MRISRVKSFMRKHGRELSIFAGILSLATFMVKDLVRENLKDLSDSLAHAQSAFEIRNGFTQLYRVIVGFEEERSGIGNQLLRRDGGTGRPEVDDEAIKIVYHAEGLEAELDSVQTLLKAMGISDDDRAKVAKLNHDISKIEKDLEKAVSVAGGDPSKKNMDLLRELHAKAEGSETEVFQWSNQVFEEATKQEEVREKRLKVVTYVMYFLLIVAAVFGVIGKALKVSGVED